MAEKTKGIDSDETMPKEEFLQVVEEWAALPSIHQLPNGLKLIWATPEIVIMSERIRQHKDDRVTGEITISHGIGKTSKTHLHRADFNFKSTTTRTQLIKLLKSRHYNADWTGIMEQLCSYVLEWVREGEPVIELDTTKEYAPPEYLLYPLLLKNEPNVIFGDGESGKSLLALLLTLMIQLPYRHNDLGLTTLKETTQVLYLDWETNKDTSGWRYKCLANGFGLPPMLLHYRRCNHTLADDIEAISNIAAENKIQCIIIDSIAAAAGGDVNTTIVADEFYKAIRKLKVTSLLLGHTSKDKSAGDDKTLYGSAFFTNYARMIWWARRTSIEGGDDISIGLYHRKANFTKRHTPLGFKFVFKKKERKIIVTSIDMTSELLLPVDMSLPDKVWKALKKHGALTAGEIAREIEAPRSSVNTILSRMKMKQQVIALSGHTWGLPAKEGTMPLEEVNNE